VLVGRDREQSLIDKSLSTARSGRGTVLAIVGEAGIGKSALLDYALDRAGDMSILRARGVQSEAQIPFGGLFELVRPALASLERVPQPQAAALEGALALRPACGEDRFAIGAATLSLLAAHAEQAPLLVIVDDAHWLDGSSANALLFAARRLVADPVLVLLAVREGEPSLLDGADLPQLHVHGLDRSASAELLRRRMLGVAETKLIDSVADRMHRETGGNPLALMELAHERSALDESPMHEPFSVVTSVAGAYLARFESLTPAARQMLVLVAASDAGDLSVLARPAAALGIEIDDIAPGEAAGLVDVRGALVEWRHPLARSAVYGGAAPEARRASHRALADAMPDSEGDRRAWHLALAALGPDATASSALEQAGTRAHDRSAYDVASRTFERAASLAPDAEGRGRLLCSAAEAAWLGGIGSRADELLDEAEAQEIESWLRVSIAHLRGHIAARRGHAVEGRRILVAAAEEAATIDRRTAVVMLADAVHASFYLGDAAAMRRIAGQIGTIAAACVDVRSEFFASMAEGMALVFSGEGDRGPGLIRHAVALLMGSDELRDDRTLLAWAAMGPLWLREATDGPALIDRALALVRSRSAVGVLPWILLHVAIDRATRDQWAQAEAAFYEAIDLARESGQEGEVAMSLSRLAWLEAREGKEDHCRAHASEALELSRSLGLGLSEVWALNALGDLELGRGRPEEAVLRYEQQVASLEARGIKDVDLWPGPELVEAHLRAGRGDTASELAEGFGRKAALKGSPWALARGARCRGLVASEDEFEACFANAFAHHAQTLDAFETARSHLAYGSRLRRHRQRVRAREELRQAIGIFDHLGAEQWSEICRAELAATGETVRRRDPASLTQLTPRELQVALLLADRRTTREAGAALFLSPKTVEYHLRSVYRKLGVATRDELAAAMARHVPPVSDDLLDCHPLL
jgi:DNA-binding CsgD family transcriptional regulator